MITALIDLDSILYKSVYKIITIAQIKELLKMYNKEEAREIFLSEVYNEGINRCENELLKMQDYVQSIFLNEITSWELYITTCTQSFRKNLRKEYKAKRKRNDYVWMLREHYKYNNAFYCNTHEADDLINRRAKELGKDKYIVISIDKDLRQISGWYWSYLKEAQKDWSGDFILNEYGDKINEYKYKEVSYITEQEANRYFWKQMLMGDSGDGIKGLKRVGEKTAEKILKKSKCYWISVAREYINRSQKEDFKINYKLLKLG